MRIPYSYNIYFKVLFLHPNSDYASILILIDYIKSKFGMKTFAYTWIKAI